MKKVLTVPRTLSGFLELDPIRQADFNYILDGVKLAFTACGFLPLDTPILEYSDVLLAKAGGETEKQIYRFKKGDTDMAMRFDLTVPLAKYVAKNFGALTFPFRRYQIGKVFRGERPQKGRFREFYQADIDIVGDGELSVYHDAEVISTIAFALKKLRIENANILLSNRKIVFGFLQELKLEDKIPCIGIALDKIKKLGKEKVEEELIKLGVKKADCKKIIALTEGGKDNKSTLQILDGLCKNSLYLKGVEELKVVKDACERLFVDNLKIDLSIVRGLDYYTGTVFESFIAGKEEFGSVASGGRYDDLALCYTERKLPGVGGSIGVNRLFDIVAAQIEKEPSSTALVVSADESNEGLLETVGRLRDLGVSAFAFMDSAKLKNKFRYAEKQQIRFLVILGDSERKSKTVSIKNIETGQQFSLLSIEEAAEKIRRK